MTVRAAAWCVRVVLLALGGAAAMAPSCARTPANATNRQPVLELRFLDVGQGDAILIRHAGKMVLVVDPGWPAEVNCNSWLYVV